MPADRGTLPYVEESTVVVFGCVVFGVSIAKTVKRKRPRNFKHLNVLFTNAGSVLKRIFEGVFEKKKKKKKKRINI